METLRADRNRALDVVSRALVEDRRDDAAYFKRLESLWSEYNAAHAAYMEALGWDPDGGD